MMFQSVIIIIINVSLLVLTDKDPTLRIESFAIVNLRGVSTKLNYIVMCLYLE